MNRETRIKEITNILENQKPMGLEEILWMDTLTPFNVYKIPLEYLVYNQLNGRILSRTQSLAKQGLPIDTSTAKGKEQIEDLLYKSNPTRNQATAKSIDTYGQKVRGIVTLDGIIIDGNRRAMFLNKNSKYDYFKAIILETTLEDNPIEIEKLETSYQMAEEKKLDYNPIEKYLKAKRLNDKNVELGKIADWMGESEKKIVHWLEVMETMDAYLDYLEYSEIYTQLDRREDQFIVLTKWLKNFEGGESAKAFDGYSEEDVNELNTIAYDYIRARYEGKEFRVIADGLKSSHLFGSKRIWRSFSSKHFKTIDAYKNSEPDISECHKSPDWAKAFADRDSQFINECIDFLKDNLKTHEERVNNQQDRDRPGNLLSAASEKVKVVKGLEEIDTPIVRKNVSELASTVLDLVHSISPLEALKQVTQILGKIEVNLPAENKDEMRIALTKIEEMVDTIRKQLGQ